jgi:predicted nucleic acid-binding protein
VKAAQGKGLRVTGTLGILDLAAERGLADFAQAMERLRRTNFRVPQAVLDALLEKHQGKEGRV